MTKPIPKPTVIHALRESIRHWQRLAKGSNEGSGCKDCALCQLFKAYYNPDRKEADDCKGCPIWEFTGQLSCKGSPWRGYSASRYLNEPVFGADSSSRVETAEDMVIFLRAILRMRLPVKKRKRS